MNESNLQMAGVLCDNPDWYIIWCCPFDVVQTVSCITDNRNVLYKVVDSFAAPLFSLRPPNLSLLLVVVAAICPFKLINYLPFSDLMPFCSLLFIETSDCRPFFYINTFIIDQFCCCCSFVHFFYNSNRLNWNHLLVFASRLSMNSKPVRSFHYQLINPELIFFSRLLVKAASLVG